MQNRAMILVLTAITGVATVTMGMMPAEKTQRDETFQLASVSGKALPVVIEEEGECREELQSGTLTLATDGDWTLVTMEREICGTREDLEEERERGRYDVSGTTLRFFDEHGDAPSPEDDDELDVADLVTGTRSSDGLVAQLADGTELTFRR